jgi:hypothetical protein
MRAVAFMSAALLLTGCAGENLFSSAGSVGGSEPTVEITAPQEAFSLALGASVQILAQVNAPNGLVSADYSGVYEDGSAAFVAETETFGRPSFANLDNTIGPVIDQTAGEVRLIVRVVDGQGEAKADTVQVTVN